MNEHPVDLDGLIEALRPGDDMVVLVGYEGEIDAVLSSPHPRPPMIYRSLFLPSRVAMATEPSPSPEMPMATYERSGARWYLRTA